MGIQNNFLKYLISIKERARKEKKGTKTDVTIRINSKMVDLKPNISQINVCGLNTPIEYLNCQTD